MDFIDTHCHIQTAGQQGGEQQTHDAWARQPELQRSDLVASAVELGVSKMICVGCSLEDSQIATDFVAQSPHTWASIGLHPHEAQNYVNQADRREAFAALATAPKVVAIGECGLDYFYEHSPRVDQIAILRFQFELARQHNLPMIFHVRGAFDDFWPIFEEYHSEKQPVRGVLHSFTDSEVNMVKATNYGLFIGVNGIATFAKGTEQATMYKAIPLSNLLLETDAPFLTPVPFRGRVNKPECVIMVARHLSAARNQSIETIAQATTDNALKLFDFL